MALEGSLRDFDLFSLFNMIKTQGKSGTLVLSRGQEFVKIFFDQGEIVGCDSNQVRMEDRVGAMLVRLGRLSGEELLSMIQLQRQTMKRLGKLLLESGKVTQQDLQDALFHQAMAIIYRTFRWVEGDYRFDSRLPSDSDLEHFSPIPVDTVLMEAARILDEWPEVQKRLPNHSVALARTEQAKTLTLDIEQELSSILEGGGRVEGGSSGLTHEQETVLTYFLEPRSIAEVLQISRYDELDTCKFIADLYEMHLLEVSFATVNQPDSPWAVSEAPAKEPATPTGPSPLFWPLVAVFILGPVLTYVPKSRNSLNQGLASLQPAEVQLKPEPVTRTRQFWALRLASPGDGGIGMAASVGCRLDATTNPIPDFSREADPMRPTPRPLPEADPTPAATPVGR